MTKPFVWTRDDDGDWECDRGDHTLHVCFVPADVGPSGCATKAFWNACYRTDVMGQEVIDMFGTADEAKRKCETWSIAHERSQKL